MTTDWLDIEWKCPYCWSEDLESEPVITEKDLVAVMTCGNCGCHYEVFNEELDIKLAENKLEGFPCQERYEKPSARELQEMKEEWEWECKRDERLLEGR